MIIEKNLEMGDYKISIKVESGTAHAHALLTDNKDYLEMQLRGIQIVLRQLVTDDIKEKNGR